MSKFDVFLNKSVLVTGNTGFKGSWLTAWLLKRGARVVGLSQSVPTTPSHYAAIDLESRIHQVWGDIRDLDTCVSVMRDHSPNFVFHLAAQPLVRRSYSDPHETFSTNTGGTLNVLEALRLCNRPCSAVLITSDKCYDNMEQVWGYKETDRLGGKDPYSGSKGAAELIIRSYAQSFFGDLSSHVRVAVGRAGNVIGGGDWAEDRIIPDAVRAWSSGEALTVRNPHATRPWQHVLEPLAGYLTLAASLAAGETRSGDAFNFGPAADQNFSVAQLLTAMQEYWPDVVWKYLADDNMVYEAGLLKLCCDKALHQLHWRPLLSIAENAALTAAWYRGFYEHTDDAWQTSQSQIAHYEKLGLQRGAVWAV